jgi:hypothetical protein
VAILAFHQDSPTLRRNLKRALNAIERSAEERALPTIEDARRWQIEIMRDLQAEDPIYVGAFRGEPGLELVQVHVNGQFGTAAPDVARELAAFEQRLQTAIAYLDAQLTAGAEPTPDQVLTA